MRSNANARSRFPLGNLAGRACIAFGRQGGARPVEGVVTIIQESRFQLLDDDGVAHHFVLAYNAAAEPEQLAPLLMRRVRVSYSDPKGIIGHELARSTCWAVTEWTCTRAPRIIRKSDLDHVIPDESELTAGVRIVPGRSYGFFTDTTLCIGCKACEVACKEWNNLPADHVGLTGDSYDNTGALSANTWRHVNFIEHAVRDDVSTPGPEWLADDERCLQALPQRPLRGGLPDRGALSHRVRYRGRAAGHLQRLRLLRPRLSVRCGRHQHARRQGAQMHAVL